MVVPARRQCCRESGAPIRRTSVYGVPKRRRSAGSAAAQTAAAVAPASAARTSPSIVVMRPSPSVASVLSTLCPEMSKHPLRDWETSERLLESGGFESRQRVLVAEPAVEASDSGARWLGVTYWQAVAGFTRGVVRATLECRRRPPAAARRRQPAHVRRACDRRRRRGGLLQVSDPGRHARAAAGRLGHARTASRRWRVRADVTVEEYLPRLAAKAGAPWWTGALYAKGQSPFHAAVSRRYFELLVRGRAG